MKLTGKSLLRIDKLFILPHRILDRVPFLFARERKNNTHAVLVIKFMGIGSIARWVSLCEEHHVDKSKVILLTFDRHSELCKLFDFPAWFIRTGSVFDFVKDCWKVFRQAGKLNPSYVVDYERCSHSVSVFRKLLVWSGGCRSISFELQSRLGTEREIIYNAEELTLEELMIKGITVMPKNRNAVSHESTVSVHPGKILVNINASDYLLARRYHANSFLGMIRSLHGANGNLEFYFTGSASERDYVGKLVGQLDGLSVFNTCGKWNFDRLMSELAGCSLFITGDSGPLHLAVYLRVPVLALWGPTQPEHFGYRQQPHLHNLSLHLPCSPCFKHPESHPAVFCHGRIDCLANLPPSDVAEKAMTVISLGPAKRQVHFPPGMQSIHQAKEEPSIAS